MKNFIALVLSIMAALSLSSCSDTNYADLVFINGTIHTVDNELGTVEAIAIDADTIMFAGSAEEIKDLIDDKTKVMDLKGATAIPGFNDSHAHFLGLGELKLKIDLLDTKSWDEVVELVRKSAEEKENGEWIIGRGWHQEKWEEVPEPNVNGYPYHYDLSKAAPDNPVILSHASGHAIIVNQTAMDLAGINKNSPDPAGGKIVRDKNNNPIGVFEEEPAEALITNYYNEYINQRSPEEVEEDKVAAIFSAQKECFENGITSFHDAGATFETIDIYKMLVDSHELKIRLNVMIGEDNPTIREKIDDYWLRGYGDHHLNVRSIKKYVDGALGSRGAWMLEPYSDLPTHSGLNVTPINELEETAEIALENDLQLCTHAIGDKGNRVMLDIYEKLLEGSSDKRWRIEHAQHLNPAEVERFPANGVIASMQTVHCTSDAVFVEKRLGEKRAEEGAYAWRNLLEKGAVICNGTDAPVERIDPIKNFYAAVTRKLDDGAEFYPQQKMTRIEALKSYTINGAYASFQEDVIGSLKPGKYADITVLSKDILTIQEGEILDTQILYTISGGKIVFENVTN